MKTEFHGKLKEYIQLAQKGTPACVDLIMNELNETSSLATTRFIDFALSCVENPEGEGRIQFYLFHGTLMQRNYASLFLNRKGDWKPVVEAYKQGLIDGIQAYAR
jgi:hypothetical protein